MSKLVIFLAFTGLLYGSGAHPEENQVIVSFYAESLCPDCIHFTEGPLTDAFEKVILPIIGEYFKRFPVNVSPVSPNMLWLIDFF